MNEKICVIHWGWGDGGREGVSFATELGMKLEGLGLAKGRER